MPFLALCGLDMWGRHQFHVRAAARDARLEADVAARELGMPAPSCGHPQLRLIRGGRAGVEQRRRLRIDRQLELPDRGKVVKIVWRNRTARQFPDAKHPVPSRYPRIDGPLHACNERLVAAKLVSELVLGQSFPPPPFDQTHSDPQSLNFERYVTPSYLVNGLHGFGNVENASMSYSVLVMRPGNRLRDMRKRAGLSQAELAERTGMTQTAISNYENGHRPLSLHNMRVFARELGCTVADLLDEQDNPYSLDDRERELLDNYRSADDMQREMVERVASPASTYRAEPRHRAA